jgi:hypothetical protein
MDFQQKFEELKVEAGQLVDKVKEVLHEGNVRRIIIKDEMGHTFMEIPLSIAAIGAIAAPLLSAVGALAALVSKFTIVIERNPAEPPKPPAANAS